MKQALLILNTILLLGIIIYIGFFNKEEKQAYVNVSMVYNDFEMKTELEERLEGIQTRRKEILDSLEFELRQVANGFNKGEEIELKAKQNFDLLENRFLTKRETFLKENQQMEADFKNQIFSQMNEYVEAFGAENNYDYLFGATGQGNIMYAQENKDITDEVIQYINEKYKGNI